MRIPGKTMASMEPTTVLHSEIVLGKRKTRQKDSLVLHLASSSEPWYSSSGSDLETFKRSPRPPTLVNGSLVPDTKKRYRCTYDECQRSYSKPSRLAEHERSHTGYRPFICDTCNKSYLRETHLQAHARSHLPESSRPLVCPQENCTKRFWTSQHLRVHVDWHNGSKAFQCSETGCDETFAKNYQLRAHICSTHAAPGVKPYRCEHEGCTKTFNTSQHLRTHSKTHNEQRYTCVHVTCIPETGDTLTYYPTWTALQHHIRTVHPPKCFNQPCNGRTFSSQKGLRAHQKLHEQREIEKDIDGAVVSDCDDADDHQPPRKRRRGGEIGRDWKCGMKDCGKDFKSKRALTTHTNVTHLGRRDHICPHETCARTFGYKHLLHRHLAKVHSSTTSASSSEDDTDDPPPKHSQTSDSLGIDIITGHSYAQRTRTNIANAVALLCPYPLLDGLDLISPPNGSTLVNDREKRLSTGHGCEYAFSRAYDLRRHLKAVHGLDAVKESVDDWVTERKDPSGRRT